MRGPHGELVVGKYKPTDEGLKLRDPRASGATDIMAAILAMTGPWMLRSLVEYTRNLIESIPSMIG